MRLTAATYDRMPTPPVVLYALLPRPVDLSAGLLCLAMFFGVVAYGKITLSFSLLERAQITQATSHAHLVAFRQRVTLDACACPLYSESPAAAAACEARVARAAARR